MQEAADCLGASSQPRYVDVKEVSELRDMKWGDWQVCWKVGSTSASRN